MRASTADIAAGLFCAIGPHTSNTSIPKTLWPVVTYHSENTTCDYTHYMSSRILTFVGVILLAVVWSTVGWALASGFPHYGPVICAACGACTYFLWSWKCAPGLALLLTGVTSLIAVLIGSVAMNPIPFPAT